MIDKQAVSDLKDTIIPLPAPSHLSPVSLESQLWESSELKQCSPVEAIGHDLTP